MKLRTALLSSIVAATAFGQDARPIPPRAEGDRMDALTAVEERPLATDRQSSAARFGATRIGWGRREQPPAPIPGRLLVKVTSSDLAERFERTVSTCALAPLVQSGLFPRDLALAEVAYRGVLPAGELALAVRLQPSPSPRETRRALQRARARLPLAPTAAPTILATDEILVKIDARRLEPDWFATCHPNVTYFRETSHIRRVVPKLGAVSVRRLFRSLERPDHGQPGRYKAARFKDALAAARQANPRRAARAYPKVQVPEDMENWFLIQLSPHVDLERALSVVRATPGVAEATVDFPVVAATNEAPGEYANQWGLKNSGTFQGTGGGVPGFDIDIESAWSSAAPTHPVVVAVLDTGFNEGLDELAGRLWTNAGEIAGDGQDNDCNGYVDDVHGITTYDRWEVDYSAAPACSVTPGGPAQILSTHATSVAGVIAAQTDNGLGIAGTAGTADVRLLNVAVGWCSPGTTSGGGVAELAEGLWYAISPSCLDTPGATCPTPATPVPGADIVNISLSTRALPFFLDETVNAALAAGVVIVASAGNDGLRYTKAEGYDSFGVFPAGMRGVLAVGGSARNARRWSSSNYGPGLDLLAPASEVRTLSFDPASPGQTAASVVTMSGTSMSAAFASGAAAVILGRYPDVTAPYMRHWLRATARDMLDPEGSGASLVGPDEWSGAGMLNAGVATVALGNPLDQPLNADLLVERLGLVLHFSGWSPDSVGGSPNLGVTVTGPTCLPGQAGQPATCPVAGWRLEYGAGDAPSTWTTVAIPDPDPATPVHEITSRPIDVRRSGSTYYRHTRIDPGCNYLNTDLLPNDTLHTVRLVAWNKSGRQFTAQDWIIPTRAKVNVPSHNTTIVDRWGWAPIKGFADIRPGASYTVTARDDSSATLWTSTPFVPANRYAAVLSDPNASEYQLWLAQEWPRWPTAFMDLMRQNPTNIPGYVALLPAPDFSSIPEGWASYTLEVHTATGATDSQAVRLYIDKSHFPSETGWPAGFPGSVNHESSAPVWVQDMGAGVGRRVVAFKQLQVACFDGAGSVTGMVPAAQPFVAFGDVDGDGAQEVLTSGYEGWAPGWGNPGTGTPPPTMKPSLHVWRADCQTPQPGFPTVEHAFTPTSDYWWWFSGWIGELGIGDITGNARKEIIYYQRPNKYDGIAAQDIRPGHLHVLDSAGAELWQMEFPPEQLTLPFQVVDADGDGKAEIVLETRGQVVEGNGTLRPGWEVAAQYDGATLATRAAGPALLLYKTNYWSGRTYEATLRGPGGGALPGWPLTYPADSGPEDPTDPYTRMPELHVLAANVIPGGNDELVFCDNKIRVYDIAGQRVTSVPEIDLDGACGGLDVLDVDRDATPEIVVLVNRLRRNVAPDQRRGSFVEAYEASGARLADSDNRWPLVLAPGAGLWGTDFTLGDVDGDAEPEAIQLIHNPAYRGEFAPAPRARVEVLRLQ